MARMGASCARSERMLLGMDRSVPSGCGRRVSLKRRTMASSSASRKTSLAFTLSRGCAKISGKSLQPLAFANIHHQGGGVNARRCRASVRRTWGSGRPADCRPSSSPRSSSALSTEPLPEPLRPVMITSSGFGRGCFRAPCRARQRLFAASRARYSLRPGRNCRRGGAPARPRGRSRRRDRPGNRGLVHLEQRFFQGHRLALLMMVDVVNTCRRLGFRFRPPPAASGAASGTASLREPRLVSRHLVRALIACFSSFSAAP